MFLIFAYVGIEKTRIIHAILIMSERTYRADSHIDKNISEVGLLNCHDME